MAESLARVVVIDDELFFREAIRDILSVEGFEVVEAGDGPTGVALAEDPTLGIAIVDIRLPGVDGLEVLRQLRKARPALRVIMLSAHTDQELVLEALRLGACDYLAKPLHDEELVLAVRRAAESFALTENWGRLRSRLDRLVSELDDLVRGAEACGPEERPAWIGQAAVEIAANVLEAARTSVMLLDEEGRQLRVAFAMGQMLDVEKLDAVSLGEGVSGRACASNEPMLVSDVQTDARLSEHLPAGSYLSDSFAVAPLVLGDRRLGVLCATERADGGAFNGEDLGLLRLLAMQVAEILGRGEAAAPAGHGANGRATGIAEGVDAEAELARLVCEAIVNEVDPERVYDAALRPLAAALPAAPVSLYLLDADGCLRCEAMHDGGARADRPELDLAKGLTGSVLRTGLMVASDAPEADARFDPENDTPEDGRPGPLLCAPLVLRGKVVGVFRAFSVDGAPASARAGEVLGSALSAAVRNAVLYRSLLESIEELAEARRAARG